MPYKIPFKIPARYTALPGTPAAAVTDTGGYDVLIGGLGFRLATDTQYPYSRMSDKYQSSQFSVSKEPGEHRLTEKPWVKSQATFHGGAGQVSFESALSTPEIEHIRYDNSQGVDPFTPGKVTRLPDCTIVANPVTGPGVMCTGQVNSVDVCIVGGAVGGLYRVSWPSGIGSLPLIEGIDLSNSVYGGASNIGVSSLATDGANYYAVLQLTTVGSTPGVLTFVVGGSLSSTASPTPMYDVPNQTVTAVRTNLLVTPSFEGIVGVSGWAGPGGGSLVQSAAQAKFGTNSALETWPNSGGGGGVGVVSTTSACAVGLYHTASVWVYVPTGSPHVFLWINGRGLETSYSTVHDAWQQLSVTWVPTGTGNHEIVISPSVATTAGQQVYIDGGMVELGSTVGTYFDGSFTSTSSVVYTWTGTANSSTSTATSLAAVMQSTGIVAWAKERLMAGLGASLYELSSAQNTSHQALPTAKYNHPLGSWTWRAITESPTAVVAAGDSNSRSVIMGLSLDTSGSTPVLAGGATMGVLPSGEIVRSLDNPLGAFMIIGTNKGIRVGTFDTYTGKLKYGPRVQARTTVVKSVTTRDRFVFFTDQFGNEDGKTGLSCMDLGTQTDSAGRYAWAPSLRAPTTAPTGTGAVDAVGLLPFSQRVVWLGFNDGLHLEGGTAGSDGVSFIRTSRIRYDTVEPKLFKAGRVRGALATSQIDVTTIAPYSQSYNSGSYGFTLNDPGEFRLIDGTWEWVQMQFGFTGSACELNSYEVKALPQERRQRIITFTVNCFQTEEDRFGADSPDPLSPRQRLLALEAMEQTGGEILFVEFTNLGPVTYRAVIEDQQFTSFSRPSIDNDLGGYITIKLRTTES